MVTTGAAKWQAFTALAGTVLCAMLIAALVRVAGAQEPAGPVFRADGPSADTYGMNEGYPVCSGLAYIRNLKCRVGAFSHYDTLFPHRIVAAPRQPSPLKRAEAEPRFTYEFDGEIRTLAEYLDRRHVTGLILARDDTLLLERYQYGRTDKHRMTSFSMAKTIIGLLVMLAIEEGAISSIDDLAEVYVRGLEGSPYGQTPIRALLQMASGVEFREEYGDMSSDIAKLALAGLRQQPGGTLAVLKEFKTRVADPGQRFNYSSADSTVLGLVLSGATGRTVSDYASEKLWRPLGAEADATWITDATGQEITLAYFNAVLRDWARLGLMLAREGTWHNRVVVPRKWFVEATTAGPGAPSRGYGYQVWLLPTKQPSFALRGLRGQFVLVAPESDTVLIQTALQSDGFAYQELMAVWKAVLDQLE